MRNLWSNPWLVIENKIFRSVGGILGKIVIATLPKLVEKNPERTCGEFPGRIIRIRKPLLISEEIE